MTSPINFAVIRKAQRAQGPATIIPDFYFRVTKIEHVVEVKEKFKRICMYLVVITILPYLS